MNSPKIEQQRPAGLHAGGLLRVQGANSKPNSKQNKNFEFGFEFAMHCDAKLKIKITF